MATFKPITTGQKPTLGTKGDAVKKLQTELNTKNAGLSGYTPLKVDGMYGPLTQSASLFTPATDTGTTKTTKSTPLSAITNSTFEPNPEEPVNPETAVDTAKIRSEILGRNMDRINAINQIYNTQLASARQQGLGRVGSTTSLIASRGLAGSGRGGALAEGTLTENRGIENAIMDEQAMKIANIYGEVDAMAVEEARRRRESLTQGADARIKYIKEKGEIKKKNLENVAQQFLSMRIDPATQDAKELADKVKELGLTVNEVNMAYRQAKLTSDAEQAKAKTDAQEYEYAKTNGYTGSFSQYQNEDANRKRSIQKDTAPTIAEQKRAIQNTLTSGIAPNGEAIGNGRGTDGYTDPYVYATAFDAWTGTTKDFLSAFPVKQNVNPASYNLLPESLRPIEKGRSI